MEEYKILMSLDDYDNLVTSEQRFRVFFKGIMKLLKDASGSEYATLRRAEIELLADALDLGEIVRKTREENEE